MADDKPRLTLVQGNPDLPAKAIPIQQVLQSGGGGGTSDGMEARMAKVEAAVEHIQTGVYDLKNDVRELRTEVRSNFWRLISTGAGSVVLIVGMLITGYFKLETKFESAQSAVETKIDSVGSRMTELDKKIDAMLVRLPTQSDQ